MNTAQLGELLDIINRYVPPERVGPLLAALRSSQAAQRNKAFAETVWRLIERWSENEGRIMERLLNGAGG